MSLSYHLWFSLKIQHHYFADEQCPVICTPDTETLSICKQNNILFKVSSEGFSVFVASQNPITPELNTKLKNLGTLSFLVQVNDPLFFNYTDISIPQKGAVIFFQNTPGNPAIIIKKTATPELLNAHATGILQINTSDLDTGDLTLTLHARKVYWQYAFKTDDFATEEFNNMEVFGPNDEKFIGLSEEISATGNQIQIFTSEVALTLSKRCTEYPKLLFGKKPQKLLKLPNMLPESVAIFDKGMLKGEFFCRSYLDI